MHHPALETIAERLSGQLRCEQEDLCRPIVQQVTRGKPVTLAALRASLQVSQDELEQRLAKLPPDVEFDRAGNILGLGVTLVPLSSIGFLEQLLVRPLEKPKENISCVCSSIGLLGRSI